MFTKKIVQKTGENISEALNSGDAYALHSKSIAKNVAFNGIFSLICYVIIFFDFYVQDGTVCLSYPLFALATVFFIVASTLESKHPFCEYSVVKRKIKPVEQTVAIEAKIEAKEETLEETEVKSSAVEPIIRSKKEQALIDIFGEDD